MNLIPIAMKYYGQFEKDGPASNPIILGWIKRMFPNSTDDSAVPWCSIFMHQVAEEAGLDLKKSGLARSWLKVGEPINLEEAVPGDVIIFWRGSIDSYMGHVGLFVNDRGNGTVRVLGGNQSNGVTIRSYSKDRILGIRRINP